MDVKLFLLSVIFVIIGIVLIINNKFYKQKSSDMMFPAELKFFLGGELFCLLGIYGVIDCILKSL